MRSWKKSTQIRPNFPWARTQNTRRVGRELIAEIRFVNETVEATVTV